jgi:hypothetical protein
MEHWISLHEACLALRVRPRILYDGAAKQEFRTKIVLNDSKKRMIHLTTLQDARKYVEGLFGSDYKEAGLARNQKVAKIIEVPEDQKKLREVRRRIEELEERKRLKSLGILLEE